MNKAFLIKTHTVLAGFFFTTTLLLIVTGGLMNLGIDGDYDETSYSLGVKQPLPTEINRLKDIVIKELTSRDFSLPKGKVDLEIKGDTLDFEWEGSSHNVILKSDIPTLKTKLIIEQASLFSYLENLHKSEGGPAFQILAIGCSFGLIILLITGVLMAWHVPRYKNLTIKSMAFGTTFFMVAIFYS